MRILTPNTLPNSFPTLGDVSDLPWFFIGGPVRGDGDWQVRACLEFNRQLNGQDFIAVVPCRWSSSHGLAPHFMPGKKMEARQTSWERLLLTHAAKSGGHGCVLFYLAKQVEPRPSEIGVYARDTLGEIGEWRGRLMDEPTQHVVVGADPDFDPVGVDVMKCNFEEALESSFPIYDSIEATVAAAIDKAMAA